MVSGVFGMFFIHRKRTASLFLSETAPASLYIRKQKYGRYAVLGGRFSQDVVC